MRCFYHPDREAVGICLNCHRGVCAESAAVVSDGLACAGVCEEQVRALKTSWFTPGITLALGAVLAISGVIDWVVFDDLWLAAFFLIVGAIYMWRPARHFLTARRRGS